MERKVISIDVKPETVGQETTETAGVMWEHNATEIEFVLDEAYVGDDYRYYLEYRSVMGTKDRTVYLSEFNNKVSFVIPAEMTALKSVECYFNIATVDGDGNTVQVIKPVKFCLDFDFSGGVDNSLVKKNDFSINLLLEAIRNGTFKGEKGDKGDSYELTPNDMVLVARKVSEDVYGLPFVREIRGVGSKKLSGVSANGYSESFEIRSAVPDFTGTGEATPNDIRALYNVRAYIGKNEVEYLLKPEKYTQFYKDANVYDTSYYVCPVFLKPNTEYVLVRCLDTLNEVVAGIKTKEGECTIFASYVSPSQAKTRLNFTTGESGVAFLVATDVGDEEEIYREVLEGTFYGLGIFESEYFCDYYDEFETPLYSLSENVYDVADISMGQAIYNIETVKVPLSVVETGAASFSYNGRIIYRYTVPLTEAPDNRKEYDVVSTHYKTSNVFVDSSDGVRRFLEETNEGTGVYFDRINSQIYIYTNKSPTTFKVFLQTQESREQPVLILYKKRNPTEAVIGAKSITINKGYEKLAVYPEDASWCMKINGCVSDALNEVLDKIEAI